MESILPGGLDSDLKRDVLHSVYLFLGPEAYLLRQAVEVLKASVVKPELSAFNFNEFDAGETPICEVIAAARTLPLMSARRLVLARRCESVPESERDALLEYLANPSDRCVLVLTAMDFDRRTSYFRSLRAKAHFLEFAKLKGAALERWGADYLRARGYRAAAPALRRLVDVVGTDLQALSNEMDKLMLCAGADNLITEPSIDELAGTMRQRGIFELTGALGRRDVRAALQMLASLLDAGESPLMILTMMARHYRQVLIVKEMLGEGRNLAEISGAAGIPAFVMDDFVRQARSTSYEAASGTYLRLAEIDRKFKSTSADHRMILEWLVCSI